MPRQRHLAQRIGVSRSGVLCIIDPACLSVEDSPNGAGEGWYESIVDTLDAVGELADFQTKDSGLDGGVLFRTGGSGSFLVSTVRDEDGKISQITIDLESGDDEVIEDYGDLYD